MSNLELDTLMHDARVLIKYCIDNDLLNSAKIYADSTTTAGNICAMLGKFK